MLFIDASISVTSIDPFDVVRAWYDDGSTPRGYWVLRFKTPAAEKSNGYQDIPHIGINGMREYSF